MSDSRQARYAAAESLVKVHGQEHLLRFYPTLPEPEQHLLVEQILALDFDLLKSLRAMASMPTQARESESIAPLYARDWTGYSVAERAVFANKGMRALRDGHVGALLVAGGQGTRLGHAGPKGTFDIGLPSGKSLFQLQAERLINLSRRAGKPIPWYIMTSPDNHGETKAFFETRRFFGLPEADVFFFTQDVLPVMDTAGKILLAEKGILSQGPNGNGGCFSALEKSGAFRDMRARGVEYLFFYSVDNALARVADPAFIGFAIESGLATAGKAVEKTDPEEKVGVFCLRNGRPSILEYSEMTPEMAAARGPGGKLLYGAANTAMHLFRRDFLEAHATTGLPYHAAHKKIAYVGQDGEKVIPSEPNAWKFELFMFDLFPKAEGMAILQVAREDEFAPVKNAEGVDSPASARDLISQLHRGWALSAGISPETLAGKTVEISPLTSYAGEGLGSHSTLRSEGNALLL